MLDFIYVVYFTLCSVLMSYIEEIKHLFVICSIDSRVDIFHIELGLSFTDLYTLLPPQFH